LAGLAGDSDGVVMVTKNDNIYEQQTSMAFTFVLA